MVGSYSWGVGRTWSAWRPPKLLLGPAKPPDLVPGSRPCTGQALSVLCDLSSPNVPLGHYKEEATSTGTGWGLTPGGQGGPRYSQTPVGAGHRPDPPPRSALGHTRPALSSASWRGQARGTPVGGTDKGTAALGIPLCSRWETEAQVGEGTGLGLEGNRTG